MSFFGLSFGASKSSSNSTTKGDKLVTGSETGVTDTKSTTLGTQNTQAQSNTASTGTSATTQTGQTTSAGASNQDSTQTSKLFSDAVQGGTEGLVTRLLAGGGQSDATTKGVNEIGSFDPTTFINDTMRAAQDSSDRGLADSVGHIIDSVGGRNNSAVSLLAQNQRIAADNALAGIRAGATQTAQGIVQSGVQATGAIDQSQNGFITNLLQALKGGVATTTGNVAQQTSERQNTSNTSNTTTAENSQTNSTSSEQTTQTLAQIINQLLNSTEHTVASENTKGSSTGIQVGASAGVGSK